MKVLKIGFLSLTLLTAGCQTTPKVTASLFPEGVDVVMMDRSLESSLVFSRMKLVSNVPRALRFMAENMGKTPVRIKFHPVWSDNTEMPIDSVYSLDMVKTLAPGQRVTLSLIGPTAAARSIVVEVSQHR